MKRKRRLWIAIGLVSLIILILLIGGFLSWRNQTEDNSNIATQTSSEDVKEKRESKAPLSTMMEIKMTRDPSGSFDDVFAQDDVLLFYEKGKLQAYDLEKNHLWSRSFSPDLILKKNVSRVLVVEKSKGNVYHFSLDGELVASALALGPIEHAELTLDNRTILFFAENRRVQIMDSYLQKSGEVVLERGAITNYGISTRQEKLALIVLDEKGGEVQNKLYLYSLEGKLLDSRGQEKLALDVHIGDRHTLLIYQDGMQYFNQNLEEEGEFISTDKIVYSKREALHLYLITGSPNPLDEAGELRLLSFSLPNKNIEFTNKISDVYDNIYSRGGLVLASYKNTLDLFNDRGELIHSEVLTYPIKKAMLLDENRLAVFDGSRFTLFKINF